MNPIISIIMPTLNGSLRIGRAIESVLDQHFSDWEFIIIDDGSTDNTYEVVKKYQDKDWRIQYIKNERNLGIQKSLNIGLQEARGIYMAHIDDDDEWIDTEKLSKQIEFLDNHSDYVLVGTNAVICDENGQQLGRYAMPEWDMSIRDRMLMKNCFLHSTILARMETIRQIGGYHEEDLIKYIEDYELWLRLGTVGKIANLMIMSTRLTIHSRSVTFQNRLAQSKKVMRISRKFRSNYPHFVLGQVVLFVRIIGFTILKVIPVPKRLLYFIQKLYKKL